MQKKIRVVVFAAFLCALEIVLNRFCSFNTLGMKVGVSFIPRVVAAILFGPWVSAAVSAAGDFIGANLFPIGPYHPGFSFSAALMGVMYGAFLHRCSFRPRRGEPVWKEIRFFPNVVIPVAVNNLVIGLFMNTEWISQLYSSKTYWGFFISRLMTEYPLLIVLELILIPLLLKMEKPLLKIVNKDTSYRISKER